jgi:hypothetical protein
MKKKSLAIVAILSVVLATAGVAYADDLKLETELSGAEEVPAVETEGEAEAKFESDGTSVDFELKWNDLTIPAFAAHIHCGVAGINGPVGVPLFTGTMGTEGGVQSTFTAPDSGNSCGWEDLADALYLLIRGDRVSAPPYEAAYHSQNVPVTGTGTQKPSLYETPGRFTSNSATPH